ncbi:MAG: rhodanese-like domain-containing protein [Saprospiraceae bacterium]
MRTLFFAAIAATLCFLSCQEKPAPQMTGVEDVLQYYNTIVRISPSQLDSLRKADPNIPLIDVRSEKEFRILHIFQAINCDEDDPDFDKRILKLNVQSPVVIYDINGSRSPQVAEKMKSLGFIRVYELAGGVYGWSRAGKTVVSGKSNMDANTILK